MRYDELDSDRKERLYQLVGDDSPHDVWTGGNRSKSVLGNIVLSDIWEEDLTQAEKEAIFLHEVGHDVDWISSFIPVLLYVFVSILVLSLFPQRLSMLTPLFSVLLILLFIPWKYMQEYRADKYAYKNGHKEGLISVLERVEDEEGWAITHPSAENRIERISGPGRD